MERPPRDRQVSTVEMFAITIKEMLKTVPLLGVIPAAIDAGYAAIDARRVEALVSALERRLHKIEKELVKINPSRERLLAPLVYGMQQTRIDILAEQKADCYAGAITNVILGKQSPEEFFDVLEKIRQLAPEDIVVLRRFIDEEQILERRSVRDLAGYNEAVHGHPFLQEEHSRLKRDLFNLVHTLMKLQGIGLIYLTPSEALGAAHPNMGELASLFVKIARVTESGRRLLTVLA